jgi:predicted PurR-regulated permease PerM
MNNKLIAVFISIIIIILIFVTTCGDSEIENFTVSELDNMYKKLSSTLVEMDNDIEKIERELRYIPEKVYETKHLIEYEIQNPRFIYLVKKLTNIRTKYYYIHQKLIDLSKKIKMEEHIRELGL